jgi:hypothetical protein
MVVLTGAVAAFGLTVAGPTSERGISSLRPRWDPPAPLGGASE